MGQKSRERVPDVQYSIKAASLAMRVKFRTKNGDDMRCGWGEAVLNFIKKARWLAGF
jgi:hypothetical protein